MALHNVEHYVDIGVKRKCQVLLVSSVAQSAGVKRDGKSAGVKRDAIADAIAGVERDVSAGVERKASAEPRLP